MIKPSENFGVMASRMQKLNELSFWGKPMEYDNCNHLSFIVQHAKKWKHQNLNPTSDSSLLFFSLLNASIIVVFEIREKYLK